MINYEINIFTNINEICMIYLVGISIENEGVE